MPISVFVRVCEKIVLDSTGFVQFRHPFNAGGFYYCFNAVMTHTGCFVAAALYSVYSTGTVPDHGSYSATGNNYTGTNATGSTDHTKSRSGTIDDFPLFAAIGTLSAVWVIAFVGLLLTMKREYVGTFVSLQTGHAYSRSHFLDHVGYDARRAEIFYCNERHWRSIRNLVRQWVLGAYAMWLQLSPAWLNEALQVHIPDDFMPASVVRDLDAQAPGGRRRTLDNMGALRRMSLTLSGAEDRDPAESSDGSAPTRESESAPGRDSDRDRG